MTRNPVSPGIKIFLALLLLALLASLLGCAPRPPTWPPFTEKLTQTSRWYVDAERFRRSAHGHLACETCHADITLSDPTTPHPDTARLALDATALYDYRTCEACHPQEYAAYENGVHATARAHPEEVETGIPTPTCGHCHDAHYATAETRGELLSSVNGTCGNCHPEALETYEENYHGKVVLLGYERAATCTDCHGAHNVLALYETNEAVRACLRCHPEANEQMVGYSIHARETLAAAPGSPRARDFALFFWVKLFFTVLVIGVLAFFYTHTALWFLRSLQERLRGGYRFERRARATEYWRFNIYNRLIHLLVLTSFFGSTISGLPLKYAYARWAGWLTRVLGGVYVMGIIHRVSAVIIALWCLMHLVYIVHYVLVRKRKPWGPDTPVPSVKDFKDLWQNFLYFLDKGSRPAFDRFAYFEKFDYWAVFWGVPIIGLSGLVLWFPAFFSRFLPGWAINVAHIMHSDEALLAIGFIYVVHLFNTHIRFDKFPLNEVIFTGKVTEEELRHERPLEWERMQADPDRLEEMRVQ